MRVWNFSAGPAVLPEEVLRQAAGEMLDWRGSGLRRAEAEAQQHDRQVPRAHRRQAGVNIGNGGPPSVGLKTTFTACSHFSLSKSQSTMLVTMRGPSARVT